MASSLGIHWSNGEYEQIPLAGFFSMRDHWKPLAEELGLKLVPGFSSFLGIYAEDLDSLLGEVKVFREALITKGKDFVDYVPRVDHLIEALERLKRSEGWEASIG